jgi:hypothetical protein
MYSHLLIGRTVYNFILNNFGFKLNYNSLEIGCIKPDISTELINIPHYKEKSFDFIIEKINSLKEVALPESQRELKKFSCDLGIVLHYISDYFCYAHNDKLMDRMPQHFFYEMNLELELRKYLTKSSFKSMDIYLTKEDHNNLKKSLICYINEKHKQYTEEKSRVSNDIYYTLQVNHVVALQIITASIVKAFPEVA